MGKLSLYWRRRVVSLSKGNMNVPSIVRVLSEEGIVVSQTSVSKFLKRYRQSGSLLDAPHTGRKSKILKKHLSFMDEKMKANDELTSEELKNLMSKACDLNISASTIRRVTCEELGWKCENTRYCQFVREPNKVKRLAFSLDSLLREDTFEDCIFTDETTVQIEQYARVSFRKDGTQAKRKGHPKHPLKVHTCIYWYLLQYCEYKISIFLLNLS